MKRILAFFLVLVTLMSNLALADEHTLTADEQAYDVYLDIKYVVDNSIEYMEELERLWKITNSISVEKANSLCHMDCISEDRIFQVMNMFTIKYGYSADEVKQLLLSSPELAITDTSELVWYYLALGVEAKYLVSIESLDTYLKNAMSGIRAIMSTDREYPFLKELQNYYKEASLMYGYASDFDDYFVQFTEKLNSYQTQQGAWSIDFEFIFNPDDYDRVMEIRASEERSTNKALYDRAVALETIGNFEEALDLYWQCYDKDTADKIVICRNNLLEEKYQTAITYELNENYKDAIGIYSSLRSYKDSPNRFRSTSYQYALSLEADGRFLDASKVYDTILDYKDSSDKKEDCEVWAQYFEPYGIKLGAKMTIHDWGVGEVVKLFDFIRTGRVSGYGTTQTYTYATIWVEYPGRGQVVHYIPEHFDYGLKVLPAND